MQLSTTLGIIIAFFVERKKRRAESDEAQSSALTKMQTAYDKFVTDSNKKIDELLERIKELDKLGEIYRKEKNELTEKIESLEKQSTDDQRTIEEFGEKIKSQDRLIKEQKRRIGTLEEQIKRI